MNDPEKLLARMRLSRSGWGMDDLHKLYIGFGFEWEDGGSHRLYKHPKFPQLYSTVGRHKSLAKGYPTAAIRLIDQLKRLNSESTQS